MDRQVMLTTFDNPFDPWDQFVSWYLYDIEKGYNSCSYLARIANLSNDMTQKEETDEIERAIDEIIAINPLNIYKKIVRQNVTKEQDQ